mmetsp:Transcript_105442/g.235407  ORF Transcript_105442/g.235407 Transcript_105442/m.235407 type:complete len:137 (+) Transcript_105442:1300-1710(+)
MRTGVRRIPRAADVAGGWPGISGAWAALLSAADVPMAPRTSATVAQRLQTTPVLYLSLARKPPRPNECRARGIDVFGFMQTNAISTADMFVRPQRVVSMQVPLADRPKETQPPGPKDPVTVSEVLSSSCGTAGFDP